jgi:hypothetical protein
MTKTWELPFGVERDVSEDDNLSYQNYDLSWAPWHLVKAISDGAGMAFTG